jgi:hypothetical protein
MLPTPSSPFRPRLLPSPHGGASGWPCRAERAEFFVLVAALPALFALFAALWIMLPA